MVFVSLTRLRVRSLRFFPSFALHTWRTLRQVRQADGFIHGALLPDRRLTFWTLTAWESEARMRQYMLSGDHKLVMPRLMFWCDEASVAHWEQPDTTLPDWLEADRRMRQHGRASKVLHPGPRHAALQYAVPRVTLTRPISRSKRPA